jgi:hypothetical protein
MQRLSRISILLLCGVSLCGCEMVKVLTFEPDKRSGVVLGSSQIIAVVDSPSDSQPVARKDGALLKEVQENCRPNAVAHPAGVVSAAVVEDVAGVAVTSFLNLIERQIDKRAKGLESASQYTETYSFIDDGPTIGVQPVCFVLQRFGGANPKDENDVYAGSDLVLKIDPVGKVRNGRTSAVLVTPIYYRASSSPAITAPNGGVDVSVATVFLAVTASNAAPAISAVNAGTFTISDVKLDGAEYLRKFGTYKTQQGHIIVGKSGLVPLPVADADAYEMRLAITETGHGIPSAELANGEFKALRAAIGPAITDFIKKKLDD